MGVLFVTNYFAHEHAYLFYLSCIITFIFILFIQFKKNKALLDKPIMFKNRRGKEIYIYNLDKLFFVILFGLFIFLSYKEGNDPVNNYLFYSLLSMLFASLFKIEIINKNGNVPN
ncbi:hypothetical protein A9Q86_01510 [Flavobacteriales bacterium 33_180_T64]|nr:hypothetical protein A9Q86_01510 [Flavobacteriales bacterium 33_180_T64]